MHPNSFTPERIKELEEKIALIIEPFIGALNDSVTRAKIIEGIKSITTEEEWNWIDRTTCDDIDKHSVRTVAFNSGLGIMEVLIQPVKGAMIMADVKVKSLMEVPTPIVDEVSDWICYDHGDEREVVSAKVARKLERRSIIMRKALEEVAQHIDEGFTTSAFLIAQKALKEVEELK